MSTNSFWRSALDEFPQLHMLFTIDASQNAHLFYISRNVEDILGFNAVDYVERSEEESGVKAELGRLIDDIATKSGLSEDHHKGECVLTSKSLHEISFLFHFRLFKNKQYPTPMIAITFTNKESNVSRVELSTPLENTEYDITKNGSLLTKMAWQRIIDLVNHDENIILVGEAGSGKEYLINKMGDIVSKQKSKQVFFEQKDSYSKDTLVILTNIDDSETPIEWEKLHLSNVQLIVTSKKSPEYLLEKKIIDEDIFYTLALNSVPIAPLRKRPEDATLICNQLLDAANKLIELTSENRLQITSRCMIENFPGNIGGLKHRFYKEFAQIVLSITRDQEFEFKGDLFGDSIEHLDVEPYDIHMKKYLASVLQKAQGKIYGNTGAAKLLKLKPTTLQSKLKKFNVK